MEDGTLKSAGYPAGTECIEWDTRNDCEVRQILDRVADKWSLLAITLLEQRTLRFSELLRQIDGISQRMLTVTLRQLERDGLVDRTVYPVVPPRVEYALTELGATLYATIQSLVAWTEEHQREIAAARSAYDTRSAAPEPGPAAAPRAASAAPELAAAP
jgi:DNA-binding HxlR family transcriptional regulator